MIYILAYLYQLFSDYAVVFYAIWGVFNSTVLQALDSPTLIVHDRPFRLKGHLGDGTNKPDRALKKGYGTFLYRNGSGSYSYPSP